MLVWYVTSWEGVFSLTRTLDRRCGGGARSRGRSRTAEGLCRLRLSCFDRSRVCLVGLESALHLRGCSQRYLNSGITPLDERESMCPERRGQHCRPRTIARKRGQISQMSRSWSNLKTMLILTSERDGYLEACQAISREARSDKATYYSSWSNDF